MAVSIQYLHKCTMIDIADVLQLNSSVLIHIGGKWKCHFMNAKEGREARDVLHTYYGIVLWSKFSSTQEQIGQNDCIALMQPNWTCEK